MNSSRRKAISAIVGFGAAGSLSGCLSPFREQASSSPAADSSAAGSSSASSSVTTSSSLAPGGGSPEYVDAGVISVDRLPYAIPPSGELKSIHLNSLSEVEQRGWFSNQGGVNAMFRNWSGGVLATDYSPAGAIVFWGGGHNGYDGTAPYAFDLTTAKWVRVGDTPPTDFTGNLDPAWADYLYNGSQIIPAAHTYGHVVHLPRRYGGGTRGSFMVCNLIGPFSTSPGGIVPHACNLETGVWSRQAASPVTGAPGTGTSSVVDTKRGIVYISTNVNGTVYRLDLNQPIASRAPAVVSGMSGSLYYTPWRYVPEADMIVGIQLADGGSTVRLWNCASGTPTSATTANAPQRAQFNVTPGRPSYAGFDYVPELNAFFVREVAVNNDRRLHKLQAPPIGQWATGAWSWSTETMGGELPVYIEEAFSNNAASFGAGGNAPSTRFTYVRALKCFVMAEGKCFRTSPDGVSRDGAVQLYRPLGIG
jgi:hypothetical protein